MKEVRIVFLLTALSVLNSCVEKESSLEILQKTIHTIDTIETIYYKQDMWRSDSRNFPDTIFRYREMYFKRMPSDSIVGVKGHWFMYVNDKANVIYEDIYDGSRLIRKNNRDSTAMIYDLSKYPEFKRNPFWGHNTPYGIQHQIKYILNHTGSYSIERLNDTIILGGSCFQISIRLEDEISMPGFAAGLEDSKGSICSTIYFIDRKTYYPVRMKVESYNTKSPDRKIFIDQIYHDIEFNLGINKDVQFITSDESVTGFEILEMKPQ